MGYGGVQLPSLVEPEKKFYLYAKCSKGSQSGTFLLSETAIALEQIDGYYHLLVGILNSENNGERSFATLYGFTEILPGRITTDKIVSSDGKTYFDLLKGEIAGYIRFLDGLIGTVGIGNKTTVNAGMSGEGNNGTDVRIWAGADKDGRWNAPFRVLHSGKTIGTDVDLRGGKIGAFDITNRGLSNVTDNPEAYIQIKKSGGKFFEVNTPGGAMCGIRGDEMTALSLSAYGNHSIGVDIIAQAGFDTYAIKALGNVELNARSGESVRVNRLDAAGVSIGVKIRR